MKFNFGNKSYAKNICFYIKKSFNKNDLKPNYYLRGISSKSKKNRFTTH